VANEIEILGSVTPVPTGLPAGWALQYDIRSARGAKEAVWRGPVSSVASAFRIVANYKDGAQITASVSPGSAVAEIRASSSTAPDGDSSTPTYEELKVAPDTWELVAVPSAVALRAFPAFAAAPAKSVIDAMESAMKRGDEDTAKNLASSNADAAKWLGLWLNGCQTFDCAAMSYRHMEHLSSDPGGNDTIKQQIQAALQTALTVATWVNVSGTGDAPFPEPKWLDASNGNAATSYQWRNDGVSISYNGDEVVVSHNYTGLWKWAKALYPGGTWEPTAT